MLNNLIFKAYSYINNNNLVAFSNLVQNHPSLLQFENQHGENLFLYASKKDKLEIFNFLLVHDKSLINSKNKNNSNYLHYIFQNNSKNIINQVKANLVENKDFFLAQNINGVFPLLVLSQYGESADMLQIFSELPKKFFQHTDLNQNSVYHYLAHNPNCSEDILKQIPIPMQSNKDNITALDVATQHNTFNGFILFYSNKNTQYYGDIKLLHLSLNNQDNRIFSHLLNNHPEDVDEFLINTIYENSKVNPRINKERLLISLRKIKEHNSNYFNSESFEKIFDSLIKEPEGFKKAIAFIYESGIKKPNLEHCLKIFTNLKLENYPSFLPLLKKNLNNEQKLKIIDKILVNKHQFFEKIDAVFQTMDRLTKDETLEFFRILKKTPTNQQQILLNNTTILSKFNYNQYKEIESIRAYFDKNELPHIIPSYFTHFYLDKINPEHVSQIYSRTQEPSELLLGLSKKIKSVEDISGFNFLKKSEKQQLLIYYFSRIIKGKISQIDFEVFYKMKITPSVILHANVNPYITSIEGQKILIKHHAKFDLDTNKVASIIGTKKELDKNYHYLFNQIKSDTQENKNKKIEALMSNIYFSNLSQLNFLYEIASKNDEQEVFLKKFFSSYNELSITSSTFLSHLLNTVGKENILNLIFDKKFNIKNLQDYIEQDLIKNQSINHSHFYYLKNIELSQSEVKKIDFTNISFLQIKDFVEFIKQNKTPYTISRIIKENSNISVLTHCLTDLSTSLNNTEKIAFLKRYYQLKDNTPQLMLHDTIDELGFFSNEIKQPEFLMLILKSDFFNDIDENSKKIISSTYLEQNLSKTQEYTRKTIKI